MVLLDYCGGDFEEKRDKSWGEGRSSSPFFSMESGRVNRSPRKSSIGSVDFLIKDKNSRSEPRQISWRVLPFSSKKSPTTRVR